MKTARRHTPARAPRTSIGRTAATLAATAALLAFSFTAAPTSTASAAPVVSDATTLAAAFATGGTITLTADITIPSAGPALTVTALHPVTLDLNGQNLVVTGGPTRAGISVPAGAELVIVDGGSNGSLHAIGGDAAAGLGGDFGQVGGTVTIDAGTVTAEGGADAAGIGGGAMGTGPGGTTTITGGTVIARGGSDSVVGTGGAGIGGGFLNAGGTTTITGGTVSAYGGAAAAGIGGGYGGSGGTTTVNGGTVTAQGGSLAAGIGAGNGGDDGGTTSITGGIVTALAGTYGSGIGGGYGGSGGTTSITGGVVTANGGLQGTAIGGGFVGDGGAVTIGTGAQVTVSASSAPDSFLIGGGSDTAGFGSLSNAGSLTIATGSTLLIPAGTTVLNSGTIVNAGALDGSGAITNTGAIVNTGSVASTLSITVNNFALSFDTTASPDSAPVAPLRVYANTLAAAQLTLPTQPVVAHHSLSWVTDAVPPVTMTPTTVLTGDLTLYAEWTLDSHTVTFDAQGGSAVESVTADYDTPITAPADPTRDGHTFDGWSTDADGTAPWNFATSTVTADTTLYAQWTIDTYTVTFDSRGGSAVAPVTVDFDTPVSEPRTPTRTGFTFDGWFSAATDGSAWDFADTVTDDVTLYAQWTAVAVVTPPTPTPTAAPTPSATPKPVAPALASTGFDGGAVGLGALVLVGAGLAGLIVRRRRVGDV